jgi:hypothetical protein
MWPWGHLAVGYLLYVAYRRYRGDRPPPGPATIVVAFGTQLPDLVDKPLAWSFEVLVSGRSLAHSWLVAAVVLAVAWWYLNQYRRLLVPFAVGWFSHGAADALYSVAVWEPASLGYLLWPVTPAPSYDGDHSFLEHFMSLEPTPYFVVQVLLFGIAATVWYRDGCPGVDVVRAAVRGVPRLVRR